MLVKAGNSCGVGVFLWVIWMILLCRLQGGLDVYVKVLFMKKQRKKVKMHQFKKKNGYKSVLS